MAANPSRVLGERETSYPFWDGQFRKALEGTGMIGEQRLFAIVSDAVSALTEERLLEGDTTGKYAVGILRVLSARQRRTQTPLALEDRASRNRGWRGRSGHECASSEL